MTITMDHPEWRVKILALATQDGHQGVERLTHNIGAAVTQSERTAFDWWVGHTELPIGRLVRDALRAYGLFTIPDDSGQAAIDEAADIAEDLAELDRQMTTLNSAVGQPAEGT